jgi:hypothetical protein
MCAVALKVPSFPEPRCEKGKLTSGCSPMPKKRDALLQKTVDALIEKADDCATLAQSQHTTADRQQESVDRQHENARELDKLSLSLVDEAVELNAELTKDESPVQLPDSERPSVH